MKILTIVGARPQFIKAAPVTRALGEAGLDECLVHTGQHYDKNMSEVFFRELSMTPPAYHLEIGSASHARQTGRMMEAIETVAKNESPDLVLIYGDTNSTLAGALVAAKMNLPLAHVEAGLRSFNRSMPEEVNRVVADRLSHWLFCPTTTAVDNLVAEGITEHVHHVGDVMYDAARNFSDVSGVRPVLDEGGRQLPDKGFILATIHRPENTDSAARLRGIFEGLQELAKDAPVLMPLHPRTRTCVDCHGLRDLLKGLDVVGPLGFLDMMAAERAARLVVTDSGGVQKEAYFHGVPCVTVREETEWTETVDAGWNQLVTANRSAIVEAARCASPGRPIDQYGTGRAAEAIVAVLAQSGGMNLEAKG